MDRIDNSKIRQLTQILEKNRSPAYALGWVESMLKHIDVNLKLSKKQIQAFNSMLDDNIRWAQQEHKN